MTTRNNAADPTGWTTPVHLGAVVNSIYADESPHLTRDGLALFFTSSRPIPGRPTARYDLWVARRSTPSEPFGAPTSLAAYFTHLFPPFDPHLSPDGATLFFQCRGLISDPAPAGDLWQVPFVRPPPLSITLIQGPAQP